MDLMKKNDDTSKSVEVFGRNMPAFCGFKPTFKNVFGHEKLSVYAGLRVFSPLSHFFLLLIVIKSLSNIINKKIKVGFWPQPDSLHRKSSKKNLFLLSGSMLYL